MVNAHPEETFDALLKNDEKLKHEVPDIKKYRTLADDSLLQKTKSSLEAKNMKVVIVNSGEEALAWLKQNIPAGKTVGNSHSTTLEEIGFVELLKANQGTGWINLHEKVLNESDPMKRAQLQKEMHNADYFVSSAVAVSSSGEITAADMSGTKVGAFSHAAGNLVLVVGTQKIVADYSAALDRIDHFALPVESARVRLAYKIPGSSANNIVAIKGPNPFSPVPRIHVVFVKQLLGY